MTFWLNWRHWADGAYRASIATDCRLPATPAGQRQHDPSATAQRPAVGHRTRLPMARITEAFWQLAPPLHADEPLAQGGGAGADFHPAAARANPDDPAGMRGAGQHDHQGASRRHGGLKKAGRKPAAVRGAVAPPRCIWWPRMRNALCVWRCLPAKRGTRPGDARYCGREEPLRRVVRCSWTGLTKAMKPVNWRGH